MRSRKKEWFFYVFIVFQQAGSFYDVVEQRYLAGESERVACQGQRHEKQILRLLAAAFPSNACMESLYAADGETHGLNELIKIVLQIKG